MYVFSIMILELFSVNNLITHSFISRLMTLILGLINQESDDIELIFIEKIHNGKWIFKETF